MFEFIDAEYAASTSTNITEAPSIVTMCGWLEVSRSGFYEWRDRPLSATAERREELKLYIVRSFEDSDGTYGYRRVHADLACWGVACGPELVRALMRELGLEPCQPKPWRHCLTEQDGEAAPIPDLVNRDFTAEAPGQKMVGDITYISTWEGWVVTVARIWSEILDVDFDWLTALSDFHQLGGDSLALITMVAEVARQAVGPAGEHAFVHRMPEIIRRTTIAHVAELAMQMKSSG